MAEAEKKAAELKKNTEAELKLFAAQSVAFIQQIFRIRHEISLQRLRIGRLNSQVLMCGPALHQLQDNLLHICSANP